MADRLRVTELDFDTIKNNLKLFLKQQNQFTDYDFDGSSLNILLDILAYNTHYNAYYLNMVANEAFLDTALLRNSVVSHAKSLGYTPHSSKAPVANITFQINSTNNTVGKLTLPRGYNFLSNQIDGKSYNFVVLDEPNSTKANSSYVFSNLKIYEGQLVNYRFVYDEQSNPKQLFTFPDAGIDTDTLKVLVYESSTTNEFQIYNKVNDVVEVTGTSPVYFLQESRNGNYEIYFGNNFVGKKLPSGAVVVVSYLVTNGTLANKANNFIGTSGLVDDKQENLTNFIVFPISEAAGGSNRETVDSIRYSATNQYTSQNRLITYKDYESYIFSNYPNLDSVSVWGGEEELLPIYGKVFISLKPKSNYFISESEKERIINDIIKPKTPISTNIVIRDPEFLYVKLTNEISYDSKKTLLTEESLKNLIRINTINYFNLNVNKFNATFALSKLHEELDNLDSSIIGIQTQLKLEKRFKPVLNFNRSYTIHFNTSLARGSILNKLTTSEFDVTDSNGDRRTVQIEEIPESFTGLSSIVVTDPGSGYTSDPIVTVTGDGFGATAVAKIVNGKIESINVVDRGINYTRAIITISGGGGFGASASAVLNNRVGTLRTIYFNDKAERQIVNKDVGQIDYDTGEINLNDIRILSVSDSDGLIRIVAESEKDVISSERNNIITIDENDSTAFSTTLIKV